MITAGRAPRSAALLSKGTPGWSNKVNKSFWCRRLTWRSFQDAASNSFSRIVIRARREA